MTGFSFARMVAVMRKETIQMRRDRLTFGMIIGIPVLQLLLFGFAINNDPRELPAAVRVIDDSVYARSLLKAIEHTGYFDFVRRVDSEKEGARLLERGEVAFVITVPADFSRLLLQGRRPRVLVEADASDPAASINALAALSRLETQALRHDLKGALALQAPPAAPLEMRVHRRFNPEGISAYNVVPGLLGVILTLTMVLITSLAVTRETERGTMENLLAMPLTPAEVMVGKLIPYVAIGYIQVSFVLAGARFIFGVPMIGSLTLLTTVLALFIAANLAVGFTFSTLARNQLQAMQMTFFFFLPSILLSGFMFPFRGMPGWAQMIGEALPLTHFLRIVRGVLLKGNGFFDIWPHIWPLLVFLTLVSALALARYRRTLD